MKIKLQITRRFVLQLVLFIALSGIALLVDYYTESHPGILKEFQACSEEPNNEHGVVHLFSQTSTFNAKSPVQKSPYRILFVQAHDKFVQKCHQLRNQLAFKAENQVPRRPLYVTCRNLVFRQSYFTFPDDEPLNF